MFSFPGFDGNWGFIQQTSLAKVRCVSFDKLLTLRTRNTSVGVKAANLAHFPIPTRNPSGNMTFTVAFPGKIPLFNVFLENLP